MHGCCRWRAGYRIGLPLALVWLVACHTDGRDGTDGTSSPTGRSGDASPADDAFQVLAYDHPARVAMIGAAGAGAPLALSLADNARASGDGEGCGDPVAPLLDVVHVGERVRLVFDAEVALLDDSPDAFWLQADGREVPLTRVAVKPNDPFVLELEPDLDARDDLTALEQLAPEPEAPEAPVCPTHVLSHVGDSIEVGGKTLPSFERVRVVAGRQLFLLLGQSNMAGRGALEEAPSAALERVGLLAEADGWVPASHPLNRYSSVGKDLAIQKVGPGYAFADLVQRELGVELGLIVNAQGGPGISAWQPGASEGLIEAAVQRAILAERRGTLRGVLWHHGEANRNQASSYGARLGVMLDALRSALDQPTLHLVAGQLGTWTRDNDAFNAAITRLPDELEHVSYVSADGLERDGTSSHFSAAAQSRLGQRYAERILHEVYGFDLPTGPATGP